MSSLFYHRHSEGAGSGIATGVRRSAVNRCRADRETEARLRRASHNKWTVVSERAVRDCEALLASSCLSDI